MSNPEPVIPLSSASKIASYAIGPETANAYHDAIELSQAIHRINLLNTPPWSPSFQSPGDSSSHGLRILELGCGQGTCTQVLAEAVASSSSGGHIDAVDPAPLDYGAPYTIGQAQSHLSSGPLGDLITWHQADPLAFLARARDQETKWDVAILAHCIWYFKSPSALWEILSALKGRVRKVLVAEYALHATEQRAVPHVLASLARAAFEAHRRESQENIQTTLSPVGIKKIAQEVGWKVEGEVTVVPEQGLSDGEWEAGTVVGDGFVDELEKEIGDERVKALLVAARDTVVAAVEGIGGVKNVRTMDVWVASFVEQ